MRLTNYLHEGRGSKQTELAESAQCIGIGISQLKGGKLIEKDFTKQNIKNAMKYVDIDVDPKNAIQFIQENNSWMQSTINVVDVLFSKKILKRRNYICHRGSSFMSSIYNRFKELKKDAAKIVGRIDNDKWNPGDIWLSTLNKIPQFENLADYNKWISEKFESGELIAISLKKASRPNPPIKIYNKFDEEIPTDIDFKSIKFPKDPFSSTGMTVDTTHGKIVFRTFTINQNGDVRGEIAGEEAAGGKVSTTLINYYLNKFIGQTMIKKADILKMSQKKKISMLKSLYKSIGISYSNDMYEVGGPEKTSNIDGWWISKLQSLDICKHLYNNKEDANTIITYLFLYASSQGLPGVFKSSQFIKVGK